MALRVGRLEPKHRSVMSGGDYQQHLFGGNVGGPYSDVHGRDSVVTGREEALKTFFFSVLLRIKQPT